MTTSTEPLPSTITCNGLNQVTHLKTMTVEGDQRLMHSVKRRHAKLNDQNFTDRGGKKDEY